MDVLNVLCTQLKRDLFAIATFLFSYVTKQVVKMTERMGCIMKLCFRSPKVLRRTTAFDVITTRPIVYA